MNNIIQNNIALDFLDILLSFCKTNVNVMLYFGPLERYADNIFFNISSFKNLLSKV